MLSPGFVPYWFRFDTSMIIVVTPWSKDSSGPESNLYEARWIFNPIFWLTRVGHNTCWIALRCLRNWDVTKQFHLPISCWSWYNQKNNHAAVCSYTKKILATSFSAVCYYTKNTWPHRFLQCALIQKTLGHIVFCSVLLYKIHLATSFSAVCSYTKNTWPHCFLQCALIQKNTLSYRFPLGITIPTTAVNIDHQLTYLVLSWR